MIKMERKILQSLVTRKESASVQVTRLGIIISCFELRSDIEKQRMNWQNLESMCRFRTQSLKII